MTEIASVGLDLAKASVKGNTIEGYASVYDHPIDEGTPMFPMTTFIRHGAFGKSIQERGPKIVSLFNHGLDPRFGSLPIGRITEMVEDSKGLHARIELHEGPDNEGLKAAIGSGSLWGMSIQFDTMQQDFNEDHSERNIRQGKLYELGPVTFPKNEASSMTLHSREDMVTRYTATQPGAEASSEGAAEAPPKDDRITLVEAKHLLELKRWEEQDELWAQRLGKGNG